MNQTKALARDKFLSRTTSIKWHLVFFSVTFVIFTVRFFLGETLKFDEKEVLEGATHLAWGYGPQLPLFFWCASILFFFTGSSLLSLLIVKGPLVFFTLYFTYKLLKKGFSDEISGFATLSLLTSYTFNRNLSDFSHGLIVLCLAYATLLFFWEAYQRRDFLSSFFLGVCLGLGLLAKYNFFFIPASLCVSTLFISEGRAFVFSRKFLFSLAVAALIVIYPYLWIYQHLEVASQSIDKLYSPRTNFLFAIFSFPFKDPTLFSLPFLLPYLWKKKNRDSSFFEKFFFRYFFAACVAVFLVFYLAGMSQLKERWVFPVFSFFIPFCAALFLESFPKITKRYLLYIFTLWFAFLVERVITHP
jgi:4-amino-4-deoxy-L-arabinose transferase-like glycosyltransferase